jgi:hypothetical protein
MPCDVICKYLHKHMDYETYCIILGIEDNFQVAWNVVMSRFHRIKGDKLYHVNTFLI